LKPHLAKNSPTFFQKKPNNYPIRAFEETVETLEEKKVSIVLPPLWKNQTTKKRYWKARKRFS
jgi:hypothetical protein